MFRDSVSDKQETGTKLFPPDEILKEEFERAQFDLAFDVYMRRRSGEIEKLIAADAKLDAEWLAEMRAKADKLSGIIRTENWTPKPVSINAPCHVKARAMIRSDKSLGLPVDPTLAAMAKDKSR